MSDELQGPTNLRRIRLALWLLVALAAVAFVAVALLEGGGNSPRPADAAGASFGGPFTLTDGEGKPFSSAALTGKPYAMFFGFTRCGDVCPTTLGRLVKLRKEAGGDQTFNIVFITIDPAFDGPREVGQYASLFGAPIIGLTGTQAQIDQVKKQYGIFAQPSAHPMPGKEMEHSSPVLLFDRKGRFAGTISATDPESDAVEKLKQLAG